MIAPKISDLDLIKSAIDLAISRRSNVAAPTTLDVDQVNKYEANTEWLSSNDIEEAFKELCVEISIDQTTINRAYRLLLLLSSDKLRHMTWWEKIAYINRSTTRKNNNTNEIKGRSHAKSAQHYRRYHDQHVPRRVISTSPVENLTETEELSYLLNNRTPSKYKKHFSTSPTSGMKLLDEYNALLSNRLNDVNPILSPSDTAMNNFINRITTDEGGAGFIRTPKKIGNASSPELVNGRHPHLSPAQHNLEIQQKQREIRSHHLIEDLHQTTVHTPYQSHHATYHGPMNSEGETESKYQDFTTEEDSDSNGLDKPPAINQELSYPMPSAMSSASHYTKLLRGSAAMQRYLNNDHQALNHSNLEREPLSTGSVSATRHGEYGMSSMKYPTPRPSDSVEDTNTSSSAFQYASSFIPSNLKVPSVTFSNPSALLDRYDASSNGLLSRHPDPASGLSSDNPHELNQSRTYPGPEDSPMSYPGPEESTQREVEGYGMYSRKIASQPLVMNRSNLMMSKEKSIRPNLFEQRPDANYKDWDEKGPTHPAKSTSMSSRSNGFSSDPIEYRGSSNAPEQQEDQSYQSYGRHDDDDHATLASIPQTFSMPSREADPLTDKPFFSPQRIVPPDDDKPSLPLNSPMLQMYQRNRQSPSLETLDLDMVLLQDDVNYVHTISSSVRILVLFQKWLSKSSKTQLHLVKNSSTLSEHHRDGYHTPILSLHYHLSSLSDFVSSLFGLEQWLRDKMKALTSFESSSYVFRAWSFQTGVSVTAREFYHKTVLRKGFESWMELKLKSRIRRKNILHALAMKRENVSFHVMNPSVGKLPSVFISPSEQKGIHDHLQTPSPPMYSPVLASSQSSIPFHSLQHFRSQSSHTKRLIYNTSMRIRDILNEATKVKLLFYLRNSVEGRLHVINCHDYSAAQEIIHVMFCFRRFYYRTTLWKKASKVRNKLRERIKCNAFQLWLHRRNETLRRDALVEPLVTGTELHIWKLRLRHALRCLQINIDRNAVVLEARERFGKRIRSNPVALKAWHFIRCRAFFECFEKLKRLFVDQGTRIPSMHLGYQHFVQTQLHQYLYRWKEWCRLLHNQRIQHCNASRLTRYGLLRVINQLMHRHRPALSSSSPNKPSLAFRINNKIKPTIYSPDEGEEEDFNLPTQFLHLSDFILPPHHPATKSLHTKSDIRFDATHLDSHQIRVTSSMEAAACQSSLLFRSFQKFKRLLSTGRLFASFAELKLSYLLRLPYYQSARRQYMRLSHSNRCSMTQRLGLDSGDSPSRLNLIAIDPMTSQLFIKSIPVTDIQRKGVTWSDNNKVSKGLDPIRNLVDSVMRYYVHNETGDLLQMTSVGLKQQHSRHHGRLAIPAAAAEIRTISTVLVLKCYRVWVRQHRKRKSLQSKFLKLKEGRIREICRNVWKVWGLTQHRRKSIAIRMKKTFLKRLKNFLERSKQTEYQWLIIQRSIVRDNYHIFCSHIAVRKRIRFEMWTQFIDKLVGKASQSSNNGSRYQPGRISLYVYRQHTTTNYPNVCSPGKLPLVSKSHATQSMHELIHGKAQRFHESSGHVIEGMHPSRQQYRKVSNTIKELYQICEQYRRLRKSWNALLHLKVVRSTKVQAINQWKHFKMGKLLEWFKFYTGYQLRIRKTRRIIKSKFLKYWKVGWIRSRSRRFLLKKHWHMLRQQYKFQYCTKIWYWSCGSKLKTAFEILRKETNRVLNLSTVLVHSMERSKMKATMLDMKRLHAASRQERRGQLRTGLNHWIKHYNVSWMLPRVHSMTVRLFRLYQGWEMFKDILRYSMRHKRGTQWTEHYQMRQTMSRVLHRWLKPHVSRKTKSHRIHHPQPPHRMGTQTGLPYCLGSKVLTSTQLQKFREIIEAHRSGNGFIQSNFVCHQQQLFNQWHDRYFNPMSTRLWKSVRISGSDRRNNQSNCKTFVNEKVFDRHSSPMERSPFPFGMKPSRMDSKPSSIERNHFSLVSKDSVYHSTTSARKEKDSHPMMVEEEVSNIKLDSEFSGEVNHLEVVSLSQSASSQHGKRAASTPKIHSVYETGQKMSRKVNRSTPISGINPIDHRREGVLNTVTDNMSRNLIQATVRRPTTKRVTDGPEVLIPSNHLQSLRSTFLNYENLSVVTKQRVIVKPTEDAEEHPIGLDSIDNAKIRIQQNLRDWMVAKDKPGDFYLRRLRYKGLANLRAFGMVRSYNRQLSIRSAGNLAMKRWKQHTSLRMEQRRIGVFAANYFTITNIKWMLQRWRLNSRYSQFTQYLLRKGVIHYYLRKAQMFLLFLKARLVRSKVMMRKKKTKRVHRKGLQYV